MKNQMMSAGLLCVSSLCHASGWTAPMTVTSAITEDDGTIVVATSDSTVYAPSCLAGYFIVSQNTDSQRARAWAAILSALATDQKIALWFGDTCATWNYHSATSVMVFAP